MTDSAITHAPKPLSRLEAKKTVEFLTRYKDAPKPPRITVSGSKEATLTISPHPDIDQDLYLSGMAEAFGTVDFTLIDGMLRQLTTLMEEDWDEQSLNLALAYMYAMKPQDTAEAMLIMQMLATHRLSLSCLRASAMNGKRSPEHIAHYVNLGTKLSRTYLAQMETLNKHRGKGQQKMTVEHVHVNEGGQAIIGNVEHGDKK